MFKDLFRSLSSLSSDDHLVGVNATRTVAPFECSRCTCSMQGMCFFHTVDYFANLLLFAVSSLNLNIILSEGDGSNMVLLSQLFGKRRHNLVKD